ncbi:MAG: AAA family ATPase [Muribaculaceae bacterium]|nr:AAA family ATPase [Muribaculaceae bacterium]
MNESLEISNFGPIKDVKLNDLKKVNLFIGQSGSGKSTIMKVLAMLRWIYKMTCIRSYLKASGITTSPFRLRVDTLLAKNGLRVYLSNESSITYKCGDFIICIKDGKIQFPKKSVNQEELTIQKIAYISDKRCLIPDLAAGNLSLRHNMFYLDETFLNFQKAIDHINNSEMAYLGVKMMVKKTNGVKRVYVSSDGQFENLPLTGASSGIQSSVALHFIMQYFASHYDIVEALNSTIVRYLAETDNLSKFKATTDIGKFPNKRVSIHLEEPELSLFPTNQWGLMKFLIQTLQSSRNADMDLTIATHSPYILTALNVMMLADRVANNEPVSSLGVSETIPALRHEDVAAWQIIDGNATNIIDQELLMIDGTYLDGASDIYDQLFGTLNGIIYE